MEKPWNDEREIRSRFERYVKTGDTLPQTVNSPLGCTANSSPRLARIELPSDKLRESPKGKGATSLRGQGGVPVQTRSEDLAKSPRDRKRELLQLGDIETLIGRSGDKSDDDAEPSPPMQRYVSSPSAAGGKPVASESPFWMQLKSGYKMEEPEYQAREDLNGGSANLSSPTDSQFQPLPPSPRDRNCDLPAHNMAAVTPPPPPPPPPTMYLAAEPFARREGTYDHAVDDTTLHREESTFDPLSTFARNTSPSNDDGAAVDTSESGGTHSWKSTPQTSPTAATRDDDDDSLWIVPSRSANDEIASCQNDEPNSRNTASQMPPLQVSRLSPRPDSSPRQGHLGSMPLEESMATTSSDTGSSWRNSPKRYSDAGSSSDSDSSLLTSESQRSSLRTSMTTTTSMSMSDDTPGTAFHPLGQRIVVMSPIRTTPPGSLSPSTGSSRPTISPTASSDSKPSS